VEKRFAVALSAKRKVEHPQNIHQFRDDLRNHDVPTIHVGHEDKDWWIILSIVATPISCGGNCLGCLALSLEM
jgi:hypothetical protein